MGIRRKTVLNILPIVLVLSFFVTPLGDYGKIWLNQLFATSPKILKESQQKTVTDYDWKLKDADWNLFNFQKSIGKVVFINRWASWKLPCAAELRSIQKLYDTYHDKVDFYMITNEERPPVIKFMKRYGFTFPVTYLIVDEKTPFNLEEIPSSYLLDKNGNILIQKKGIADWGGHKVYEIFNKLTKGSL